MGKYNIKRYVRNDGIQGTPEDYSTIEMLNNNHYIMIDVNAKSFVLVRRSDSGKIICYRLNTSPFMKESKYEFKSYIDNEWSSESYYANKDIPSVGEEIFDVNDNVIGTITEVSHQKITLNDGTILYRFFGGDISSLTFLHYRLSDSFDKPLVIADDNLTHIIGSSFQDCDSLTSIDLSGCNNLTSIGKYCFDNCDNLTNVVLPSSLETIGENCFYNCSKLTTITINKPQDSISGAPWGAPNATLVWNG